VTATLDGRPNVGAPLPELDDGREERIPIRSIEKQEAARLAAAALASLCVTWLIYERLTPLSGGAGFAIVWFAVFIAFAWWVARATHGTLRGTDQLARVVIWSGGMALLIPLVMILLYTLGRGYHALRVGFFIHDSRYVGSLDKSTAGGGEHAIIGTFEEVVIAGMLSVPLGVATAIYLNEVGGKLTKVVRTIVDAMSALPSIVAGLFIFSAYIIAFHKPFTGFAGGLALAVMMLPTVTRMSELVLRLVPSGLREAGMALGGTEWRTTRDVVLPTARSGLVTGVILGVARVIGETAPLLLTIGGSSFVNWNAFHGQQEALPLFIYDIIRAGPGQLARAWTGALVLVLLVLVLFTIARIIGGRGPAHISRFKRWRLARQGLA
jgi:phosphate transport system permease protein